MPGCVGISWRKPNKSLYYAHLSFFDKTTSCLHNNPPPPPLCVIVEVIFIWQAFGGFSCVFLRLSVCLPPGRVSIKALLWSLSKQAFLVSWICLCVCFLKIGISQNALSCSITYALLKHWSAQIPRTRNRMVLFDKPMDSSNCLISLPTQGTNYFLSYTVRWETGRWGRRLIGPLSLPAWLRCCITQQLNGAVYPMHTGASQNNPVTHRCSQSVW